MTGVYQRFIAHLGATRPQACGLIQQEYPMFLQMFKNEDTIVTLNAFWRAKLATLPINTIEIRAYLRDDDNLSIDEWLLMFDGIVLPYVNAVYNLA